MPRKKTRRRGHYTPKKKGDKWKLQWPIPGLTPSGKQKTKTLFFDTEAEANSQAAKVNEKFRQEGFKRDDAIIRGENRRERIPQTGKPVTLHEAGKLYIQAYEKSLLTSEQRKEANPNSKKRRANEMLASSGEHSDTYVSENTLNNKYRPAINQLCDKDDLGAKLIKDVDITDLRWHLNLLDLAVSTYNDRINIFSRLFRWCMEEGREFLKASPAAGLSRLKEEWQEPEILTVDEITRVFRAAEDIDPGIIPELSLRAHASLRACEVKRIDEKDINWKYRFVDVLPTVAKRKSPDKPLPRKIEGLPDTVWRWMESVGGENMRIDRVNLYKRLKAVFEKAGVFYTRNCLRHSFCSYAFALTGDDGKVRKWSGHRTEKAFYNNYVNVTKCTKAEAIDYFALAPSGNHVDRLGKRRRRHQPTINWPETEEFRRLISEVSNVKIGKLLGCTEAAVRKERKKRNI